jgi:hypothetical protein
MTELTRRQLRTPTTSAAPNGVAAKDVSPDERAREVEQKMSDDERSSLIISLIGAVPLSGLPRDKRIPEDATNMSAGHTPGIPRLGIPRQWRIAEGTHRVMLGKSARESVLTAEATLDGRLFGS